MERSVAVAVRPPRNDNIIRRSESVVSRPDSVVSRTESANGRNEGSVYREESRRDGFSERSMPRQRTNSISARSNGTAGGRDDVSGWNNSPPRDNRDNGSLWENAISEHGEYTKDRNVQMPEAVGRVDSTFGRIDGTLGRRDSTYSQPQTAHARAESRSGRPDLLRTDTGGSTGSAGQYYGVSPPSVAKSEVMDESSSLTRDQLAKAQDLLSKQNRLKLRLKSELTATRTELLTLKSELALARDQIARAQEVEVELSVAKELLVTYKSELCHTQEAQSYALDYLLRSADRHWFEIEMELSNVRRLLDHPLTPLHKDDDIAAWMPVKRIERCWDSDSEWDSDIEWEGDLDVWWRRENPFVGEKKRAGGGSGESDEYGSDVEGDERDGDVISDDEYEVGDVEVGDVGSVLRQSAAVTAESYVRPSAKITAIAPNAFVKGFRLPDGSIVAQSEAASVRSASVRGGGSQHPRDDLFDPITGGSHVDSDDDDQPIMTAPVQNFRAAHPSAAAAAAKMLSRSRDDSPPTESGPQFQAQVPAQPAKRNNSWFRPIQTWVEQLGEQLAPPPPKAPPKKPAVVRVRHQDVYRFDGSGDGARISIDSERANNESPRGSLDMDGVVREAAFVAPAVVETFPTYRTLGGPTGDMGIGASPLGSPTFGVPQAVGPTSLVRTMVRIEDTGDVEDENLGQGDWADAFTMAALEELEREGAIPRRVEMPVVEDPVIIMEDMDDILVQSAKLPITTSKPYEPPVEDIPEPVQEVPESTFSIQPPIPAPQKPVLTIDTGSNKTHDPIPAPSTSIRPPRIRRGSLPTNDTPTPMPGPRITRTTTTVDLVPNRPKLDPIITSTSATAPKGTTTTAAPTAAAIAAGAPTSAPPDEAASALEKITSAFESAIENAIENPWSFVPGWLRSSRAENGRGRRA